MSDDMTALDVIVLDSITSDERWEILPDARAELAALRAEVTALRQTVEEARRLLIDITDVFGHDSSIDAWLAAHSAPEVTP